MTKIAVPHLDLAIALHRYLDVCPKFEGSSGFYDYLNDQGDYDASNDGWRFNEEAARKIAALNSPNWYVILKVYKACQK